MPAVAKFVEGPLAFGYVGMMDDMEGADGLCHFIGKYVGQSYGIMNIRKMMRNNKGMTWLDMMTLNQFTNMISVLANHNDQWTRELWIKELEDDEERYKYKNFDDLEDGPDKFKYTPTKSKFSASRGKKREFGVAIWSDEGKIFERDLKLVWGNAFHDKDFRNWIGAAWEDWVIANKWCQYWRKKESKAGPCRNIDAVDDEGEMDLELMLEGDDDFQICRPGVFEDNKDDDMESVLYGSSLLESF